MKVGFRHLFALMALPLAVLAAAACSGGPLRAQEPVIEGDRYYIEFTRPNGDMGAMLFVWLRQQRNGLTEVVVELPTSGPETGYRLDSFTLELIAPGSHVPHITMEPAYGWDALSFHRHQTDGVRLHVPGTGPSGDGTILLNFWAPEQLIIEHDLIVRASLQTRHGEASGQLRVAKSAE